MQFIYIGVWSIRMKNTRSGGKVMGKVIGIGLCSLLGLPAAIAMAQGTGQLIQQQHDLRIAAQPLERALFTLANQAGSDLLIGDVSLGGLQAPALQGRYSLEESLQLLLQGTDIGYRLVPGNRLGIQLFHSPRARGDALSLGAIQVAGMANSDAPSIYQQPRSLSEITREQLDRRPARHAADILEQTSGVYSSVSQQDPALSVNIRGIQDYGRVNMNVDGMRQNFQKSNHGQRNGTLYIDPEMLSGVLVEKGPSSGLGGAGVIGGIATFNTLSASDFLEPGKELGGKIKLGGGDNGTHFIGSGAFAVGNERWDLLLAASERRLGDYDPGRKGDIGDIRTSVSDVYNAGVTTQGMQDALKRTQVTDSGYTMRSRLLKLGLNLPRDQRLQMTYLQTSTNTPNVGMITAIYDDPSNTRGPYTLGWKSTGFSQVTSRNLALDYSLAPEDSRWLDLKAKLYYVDTEDSSDTYSTSTSTDNSYWTDTRVRTYGLQLDNNARLFDFNAHRLAANYGLDVFYDKAGSQSSKEGMEGVTPSGNRSMASLFSQLRYDYGDWLKVEAGLRYDRWRLRGNTGITVWQIYDPCTQASKSRCTYQDLMSWDVDRKEERFSPSLAIAVKPGPQWLELFANYGKAWRPAAITETLASGSAHSSATQYPNPYLEAERSKSWEAGFNVQWPGLLVAADRLVAKVAYFDTKVDNYSSLSTNRILPGYGALASSGYAAYVNNLLESRFRGVEYQLNYDAGFIYADLTYTRMIGANENNFCSKLAWLGNKIEFGGERGNWYPVAYDEDSVGCTQGTGVTSGVFSNFTYLPGDRGSLTLGGRAFDRRLDIGAVVRYNRGKQDDSVVSSSGSVGSFYVADWPEYTVVDLYARFNVTSALTLHASVENLMDRAYVVGFGDSLAYTLGRGRTVQGAVEYRF